MEPEVQAARIQSMIRKGRLDEHLPDIIDSIARRGDILRTRKFAALQVGDQVRVVNFVKPKYMAGLVGTVVDKRQTKVEVEFPDPVGRFGRRVICPMGIIEVLD